MNKDKLVSPNDDYNFSFVRFQWRRFALYLYNKYHLPE